MTDYAVIRIVSDKPTDHGLVKAIGYIPGEVFYLSEMEPDMHGQPATSTWEANPKKALRMTAGQAEKLVAYYRSLDDQISTVVEHSTDPPLPIGTA